ncbi:hypothetical protein BACPEC_01860 [[Bacteroides] pectinophilus ATCC 43243]|uniref:Uncharacterized protein n=1 Tax=[Bacteroides] pectinophilus ATCC 43243 TaxID=483218 RepID=B7AS06_9FIRM|nr:hypothetical protein BACPEC_01860 [[Bacteroides] pectinophilus ATCC 43243]
MYLLIPGIEPATQGKNEDLHSNMYLLIRGDSNRPVGDYYIYIPTCIY